MNTFNFSYQPPDESKYVPEKNLIRGCMRSTPTIFVSRQRAAPPQRGLFKLIWIQNGFAVRGRMRGQRNHFCIQSPYVRARVRVRVHTCRGGGAGHVTLERAGHVTLEKELE